MSKVVPLADRPQQFNVQLPPKGIRLLTFYAERTQSIATAGISKGQVSIGALIRRISEGEIQLSYKGSPIHIPVQHIFEIKKED